METSRAIVGILILIITTSCSNEQNASDAYGQFEATEIRVSAQARGQVKALRAHEGEVLDKGQKVGMVDTSDLVHQRNELEARIEAAKAKLNNIEAEKKVLQTELEYAKKDLNRIRSLHKEKAATEQQLEDVEGKIAVINQRINSVFTQKQAVKADINALRAKLARVDQQKRDARIINPVTGTVLATLVESGEVVRYGQPLYKIADLSTMELRVYVSGAQLPDIELGQKVTVLIDKNKTEYEKLEGTVSWIASEAEFTPQMIQTKEERVNQVYAVEIRVKNEGSLKIGMPGEVKF